MRLVHARLAESASMIGGWVCGGGRVEDRGGGGGGGGGVGEATRKRAHIWAHVPIQTKPKL